MWCRGWSPHERERALSEANEKGDFRNLSNLHETKSVRMSGRFFMMFEWKSPMI